MKVTLKIEKEFNIKYLAVKANVRHWEDATVNGVEDTDGKIPCRGGDNWCPLIDIDKGVILNWVQGATAEIHYKVCDAGEYSLLDDNKEVIKTIDGYVPKIMCPEDDGYGDYIIMNVLATGQICNWAIPLDEFTDYSE